MLKLGILRRWLSQMTLTLRALWAWDIWLSSELKWRSKIESLFTSFNCVRTQTITISSFCVVVWRVSQRFFDCGSCSHKVVSQLDTLLEALPMSRRLEVLRFGMSNLLTFFFASGNWIYKKLLLLLFLWRQKSVVDPIITSGPKRMMMTGDDSFCVSVNRIGKTRQETVGALYYYVSGCVVSGIDCCTQRPSSCQILDSLRLKRCTFCLIMHNVGVVTGLH